jgi:hypothetical protein
MFFKIFPGIGLSLICIAGLPLSAATVSVAVVETGLQEESPRSESSNLWENGLMDVFFDAGHIVSNAPLMRLPGKPAAPFPEELRDDLAEAAAGGMEFLVLALLEYQETAAPESGPRHVSLRLFRIDPLKLIVEQDIRGGDARKAADVYALAKSAARGIATHIKDK